MASGKKRNDFGVMSDEPCGTTFEHAGPGSRAGATNTKRNARFGVEQGPHGATFTEDSTHIKTPNADQKPKESKVISAKGGQGSTYSPPGSGPKDFGGSVGVGKSSPKRGKTMSTTARL